MSDLPAPPPRMPSRAEFVALMAMLMAMIAFSIDAMLPALPRIAEELSPAAPNAAQLIVASLVLGMGLGTIVIGPLSDSLGRKPVLIGAAAIYAAGAALAWAAPTLETLLLARVIQGFGAAGPRVTVMAMIRDLFAGRQMAQVMSFVIIVFTLVPAIAPTIGAGVIALAGWRALFPVFIATATIAALWLWLRQPETLAAENRRRLRVRPILEAVREVVAHPVVRCATLVQVFAFGMLFANVSTTQMVFDQSFGRAGSFPYWFGAMAILGAAGGALNARVVMRVGMRDVVAYTLGAQALLAGAFLAAEATQALPEQVRFGFYMIWSASVFATAGLTLGNINAIAMEPMGHIAGTAATVVTAIGTMGAGVIAGLTGLAFDGTPRPVAAAILLLALSALWLMRRVPQGGDAVQAP